MKKTNPFIFLFILSLGFSCCGRLSKESPKWTENEDEKTSLKTYKREWIDFEENKLNIKRQIEIYISEIGDTLYNQEKNYVNGQLDSAKSNFYNLDLEQIKKEKYSGKITVYSSNLKKIKSPIIRRSLELYLLNQEDTINWDFQSINSNHVEFAYNSSHDTLKGILFDKLQIDTVVNGEKMVRLLESVYFVDNKVQTDNTFIDSYK